MAKLFTEATMISEKENAVLSIMLTIFPLNQNIVTEPFFSKMMIFKLVFNAAFVSAVLATAGETKDSSPNHVKMKQESYANAPSDDGWKDGIKHSLRKDERRESLHETNPESLTWNVDGAIWNPRAGKGIGAWDMASEKRYETKPILENDKLSSGGSIPKTNDQSSGKQLGAKPLFENEDPSSETEHKLAKKDDISTSVVRSLKAKKDDKKGKDAKSTKSNNNSNISMIEVYSVDSIYSCCIYVIYYFCFIVNSIL